ncbi:hypothetical protein AJ80_06491 [Polytolypa hystricis UAMH7299]|uniref:Aminoglycoside phosphotransferase domain-containing protein n=1 Tax=Polytolypa hystricis (strain UAMH7299) TaxID=1447883 RepID=A0A2B7XWY9_POLH7|nr:hypothetical protein AJ80_06491 [Polytolypa hystricis UAMH7299]
MKFIRRNTSIPVPEVIAHGTAAENPTGLGPFIIMTWIEGTRMKELLEKRFPTMDGSDEAILNPNIDDKILRSLYDEVAKIILELCDLNGPFKLFCDDLGPGNILVDPSTLKATGVIDREFCYAAPAQFLASPPSWLLLKQPNHWVEDGGLQSFLQAYLPKLDLFLQAIEENETKRSFPRSNERLSARIRQSMEDKTICPASITERVARTTNRNNLYHDREAFVRTKIADLQRYNDQIGKKLLPRYQEEEDDEKLDYWKVAAPEVSSEPPSLLGLPGGWRYQTTNLFQRPSIEEHITARTKQALLDLLEPEHS